MQNSSFEKGELFEKFVEDELFKASGYDLVSRTNSYEQNKSRYSEDTKKPDFKFRCKKTQQQFYVEAKFRSGYNANNMIEVMSYNQIERFKVLQDEENIPIYIVIGYNGSPFNPYNLSLIPLNELAHLNLYDSFLRRFNIHKQPVNSSLLNLPEKLQEQPIEDASENHNIKQVDTVEEVSTNRNKAKIFSFAAGIALIVITAFIVFNHFDTSIEDTLKEKTSAYYGTIQSGNIDALENFIGPKVDKWYSQYDMTFPEIKKQTLAYIKRHPKSKADIQWSTFKVTPQNNNYVVTYNMIYKLLKEDKGVDKIYNLKIHAIWDEDLKIKSLYEEKI